MVLFITKKNDAIVREKPSFPSNEGEGREWQYMTSKVPTLKIYLFSFYNSL